MNDFRSVTELTGDQVTKEQIERLAHRYRWAGEYCHNKDVLDVACGAGQGLGLVSKHAKTLRAGDITPALVERARLHYGRRVVIEVMDAMALPLEDECLDVIICFEAIYYLPSAVIFIHQCRRVLRRGGRVLIATANKDLFDFNPSPLSHQYYGIVELGDLFGRYGFSCAFFGNIRVDGVSLRQQVLRPIKAVAVRLGLMPKTMAGKKLLKRLVFGRLVPMPAEIDSDNIPYRPPIPLEPRKPDQVFKVIYLCATLENPESN